ncbi:hypothetical protein [Truepera radiovictrix]|uniref:Uncharacterized protein n=1 Tax=Truepera radiovictrix (strain DSM 17093 / CIP 108686 / LMG 22925 / RQ-24) TaxID=649638 RepID=D7CXN7_TRURR|nr:hypothetical protein [Truepera radiovictrix]ADI14639.1 conserved hypothetical protein [Truepera radiovictrix DSM 17093]WMT56811.1 hypothetical protein RCV51_12435 [Truepera radiovictrix]
MRSRALNFAFNRALIDPQYRARLFRDLRRTLLEAGVPEAEIAALARLEPRSLEALAEALETLHTGAPTAK